MSKRRVILAVFVIFVVLMVTVTCYAVTEEEVSAAVNASSKESVSGNLFIWFICAIAFLKISQKIDSFMSSLGVSVGRTGGSMLAEAVIAARGLGTVFKAGNKFAGFGKGSNSSSASGGTAVGFGGMFGGFGRKAADAAVSSVTESGASSSGLFGMIGKQVYNSSLSSGGRFAAGVISSVARGDISKMGTINGNNAKAAMESYFGYNKTVGTENGSTANKNGLEYGGGTSFSDSELNMSEEIINGAKISDEIGNGINMSENAGAIEQIPQFTDVEMGGGRITGTEMTPDYPDGRQFAMYDIEKYEKPNGNYEIITAVDDSKWYKQYSQPSVEKTPYMNEKGKVEYNEKIVDKMPKAPVRKDRI